jgi:hypothetical protein
MVASDTIVQQLPNASAATVICLLPAFTAAFDNMTVFVAWQATITPGVGDTNMLFQVFRGKDATGVPLGLVNWDQTVTPGAVETFAGFYIDNPGATSNTPYALVCQEIGVSAGGTVIDVALVAFAL